MPEMPEIPAEAVQAALSSLRLLPRGRLPEWRIDLSRVLLCDMHPVTPLHTRLDMLRAWSALLGAPIGYDHRPTGSGYVAGYLHVRVVRDGVDARVRAFITPTEAAHADVLTILHGQETTHAEALANAECEKRPRCTNCMADAVMAVRDTELERLRAAEAAIAASHEAANAQEALTRVREWAEKMRATSTADGMGAHIHATVIRLLDSPEGTPP